MRKNSRKSPISQGRSVLLASRLSDDAAELLRRRKIGVLLTDTIYGVVGSALSKQVVERIYEVKGRDDGKPLIVLLASLADLAHFRVNPTAQEKRIVRKILREAKRPTTVILPVIWKRSEYLHRGTERFRFRIPGPGALRRFLTKTGPLVAPSANPQGEAPAENIRQAMAYFGDRVDFYVDSGTNRGKPSRLVEILPDGNVNIIRK
jgi:L-threonylcarbamoyladenylate synthase